MKVFLVLFVGVLGFVDSNNSSFGIKFNTPALEIIGPYAAEIIKENFKKLHIPNVENKHYQIKNIRIVSLNPGSISFLTESPNVLGVSIVEASVTGTAWWRASLSYFGALSGNARVSLTGISITQKILLEKAPNSALHICNKMDKELTEYVGMANSNYPVSLSVGKYTPYLKNITVNTGLTVPPQVTNSSVSLFFNAWCYNSAENPHQQFPFSPTTLPSFGIPNQMTQAMLSQYGPNTFLYSLWQIDHYAMSYTEEQISSVIGVQVNASLLAQTIPKFHGYIGRPLTFAFCSAEPFRIQITTFGVTINGEISTKVNVLLPDDTELTIITNNITIQTEANVKIKNNTIFWNITSLNVEPLDSGPTSAAFKDFFQKYGLPIITQYRHNRFIDEFTLPEFYGFRVAKPSITFEQNVVLIGASIEKV